MKIRFFAPASLKKGQKQHKKLLLGLSVLALSGCMTTGNSEPLAPQPPVYNSLTSSDARYEPHYFVDRGHQEEQVMLAGGVAGGDVGALDTQQIDPAQIQKTPQLSLEGCNIKDRFDRKALLAYEWDRSRLSVDVDGVNFDSGDDRAIRLEYRIRLQPEKPRKERCRYGSKWQGMIGSGYNEFFVRENDTVWTEIKEIRRETMERIGDAF